jgi:hypothetical protein
MENPCIPCRTGQRPSRTFILYYFLLEILQPGRTWLILREEGSRLPCVHLGSTGLGDFLLFYESPGVQ